MYTSRRELRERGEESPSLQSSGEGCYRRGRSRGCAPVEALGVKVGSMQGQFRGGTLETPRGPPRPAVATTDRRPEADVPRDAWRGVGGGHTSAEGG
jgi:hypothetical protein